MGDLDNLKTRIEHLISELRDINDLLIRDINDPQKAVPISQVKEIESSIERMKKQGFSVPTELKELKVDLFSKHEKHKERKALYQNLQESIRSFIKSETPQRPKKSKMGRQDPDLSSARKSPSYEKPLGNKGNSNLEDYLIPVVKLMWSGRDHKQAFREIAEKLDVRYNTVSAQCTRTIGLTTEQFIEQVNSRTIADFLATKYPAQYQKINVELKS